MIWSPYQQAIVTIDKVVFADSSASANNLGPGGHKLITNN